jgi:cytochrome P450
MGRSTTIETVIAGQTIPKGDFVMLSFAAACRDPNLVENPESLDIDRDVPASAAFGFGPHRCPGLHLARLEAAVVLREFLRRIPNFAVASGDGPTFSTGITRSIDRLSLVFNSGSEAS